MTEPFALYHWSPTDRRKSILHDGLKPGHWSTDRLWRPPVLCFADTPARAWGLSGLVKRSINHDSWDLWMIWSNVVSGYEVLPFDDGTPKEYRIYERIWKRDVWYVATRETR